MEQSDWLSYHALSSISVCSGCRSDTIWLCICFWKFRRTIQKYCWI